MATMYPSTISVTSLDGQNGFAVFKKHSDNPFGNGINPIGDINGDGFADLITSVWHQAPGKPGMYTYHILFGRSSGFMPAVKFPDLHDKTGLTSTDTYNISFRSAGDLNGDGIGDILFGVASGYRGASQPWKAGSVNVIFGTRAGFETALPLTSLDGKNGFQIKDSRASSSSNPSHGLGDGAIASAGDVNGDGFGDLIVGAHAADNGDTARGAAFVVYGRKDGFPAKLEIADINGTNGSRILLKLGTSDTGSGIGTSVAAAGDVNGDGLDDIVVVGNDASYVVFGRKGGFGASFDLKILNGRNGFAVTPQDKNQVFSSFESAGDINGDGIDDLIVLQKKQWYKTGSDAGVSVIFGKKTPFDPTIALDRLSATDGFKITGTLGDTNLSRIGDFNGDGIDDIAIATGRRDAEFDFAEAGVTPGAQNVFIVFGKKGGFPSSVSLDHLDGKDGVQITGVAWSRAHVLSAGDINGDGAADIIIGTSGYNFHSTDQASYIVFGNTSFAGLKRDGGSLGETLTGAGNGDVLNGFGGADHLIGLAGDDRLDGGTEIDRLEGGVGDDTYLVDQARDVVVEGVGQGRDTVIATASYGLAAGSEIETLRLDPRGRGNLSLAGNEFNNRLYGNAGNNVLAGGGGNDRLFGGAGNDFYIVGPGTSLIYEGDNEGEDRVLASSSYQLNAGVSVESMQLMPSTKTAALNLAGNEYSQTIVGNGGRNVLDGQGSTSEKSRGADSLYGQGGSDVYIIRRSDDKVYEAANEGTDGITSWVSYKLAAGQSIETLQFRDSGGRQNLDLSGNEFANALYGNRGNNVLEGEAGADVLNGREGADVLSGGSGADIFRFSTTLGANNIDRITDFEASDTIELLKTVFTALALGQLPGSAFKDLGASGAKLDADDRIVYDSRTGALSYDADGSGAAAAVQFATLVNKAAIGAGDFLVV